MGNARIFIVVLLASSCLVACARPAANDAGHGAEAIQFVIVDDAWTRCFDKVNDGTDGPVMACIGEGRPTFVGLLDQILAERRRRLSSPEWSKLRFEQSRWRERAKQECDNDPDFKENDGLNQYPGTAAAIGHDLCEIEATRRRASTLIVRELRAANRKSAAK